MKRFIILLMLLVTFAAGAQTVIVVNEATLEWDAVTTLSDESPIPPGAMIEYEVYQEIIPLTFPDNPAAHLLLGTTSSTSFAITIPATPYQHTYGLRTKMTDGATVLYSPLVWSSVVGTPSPFVYRRPGTVPPKPPDDLRGQ